jgi:hypothetical protein
MEGQQLTGESIKLNDRSQSSISSAIKAIQQTLKNKADKLDTYTQEEIEALLEDLKALSQTEDQKILDLLNSLQESKLDKESGKGLSTNDFTNELKLKLENLKQGLDGEKGDTGDNGLSAYELAKQEGFNGSLTDWIKSLKGEKGEKGQSGSDGLDGKQGERGLSAYEIAVRNGFRGTENQWLQSLKGKDGKTVSGGFGVAGASAYQIAVRNGFKGTEQEWLASLKGSGNGGYDDAEIRNEILNIKNQIGNLSSGSDSNYVHNQSQPLDTWSITHNLNKYPSVTVIDSAGSKVEGTVTYISNEEIKIEFSSPFSGKVILN